MTLVQTLTQKLPATPGIGQSEPQLPEGLPEPYLDIARHCLLRNPQARWTVAQIAARLQNPLAIPEPSTPLRVAQPPVKQQAPQVEPKKRRNYAIPIAVGLALLVAAAGGAEILAAPLGSSAGPCRCVPKPNRSTGAGSI